MGDITPNCGVSKEEKQRLEADAIADIQKMLGEQSSAGEARILCAAPCEEGSAQ